MKTNKAQSENHAQEQARAQLESIVKQVIDELVEALKLAVELSERNDNGGSESQYMRHVAKAAIERAEGRV